jgi:hypothetical protein
MNPGSLLSPARREALSITLRASAGLLATAAPLAARAGPPDWGGVAAPSKAAPGLKPQTAGVTAAARITLFSERPFLGRSQVSEPLPDNLIVGFGSFYVQGQGLGGGTAEDTSTFGKVYLTSPQLPARYHGRFDLDVRTWNDVLIKGYVGSLEVLRGHSGANLIVELRGGQRLTHAVYVSPWPANA